MKITLTRDTGIKGEHVAAGTTVDLPDRLALELISLGKAQPASGKAKTQDRSVGLDTKSAAALTKRKRRK